jgi:hypothetical protein
MLRVVVSLVTRRDCDNDNVTPGTHAQVLLDRGLSTQYSDLKTT